MLYLKKEYSVVEQLDLKSIYLGVILRVFTVSYQLYNAAKNSQWLGIISDKMKKKIQNQILI